MRARLVWFLDWVIVVVTWGLFALVLSFFLARDVYVAADTAGQVRAHVRTVEFDFLDWTLAAVGGKLRQASVDEQHYLSDDVRADTVRHFIDLRRELEQVERDIQARYGDPAVTDKAAATAELSLRQAELRDALHRIQPLAETILQEQLSVILAEQGLTTAGQPIPPVAFQMTPLPFALIVSPRDVIRQDANMDVDGELTLEELVAFEDRIAGALDVSTLIVPLGGIGTYPTMVAQSSDLSWLTSVVAHEWLHNYLTLRPLGLNYLTSGELRTMNETTAEMIGNELGALVIDRYYPDLSRPEPPFDNRLARDLPLPEAGQAPDFDFRAEMHTTRVNVDRLLAEGKVDEAEAYMEARRVVMWDHGYQIRKLNQAYFAFYGAYAAGGGGAAGADPVGTAVRLLRRRSSSIAQFVNTMAWFTSFGQLQEYLGLPRTS